MTSGGVESPPEAPMFSFAKRVHLLSDLNHQVIEAYGAWQEKKIYGKTYMGIVVLPSSWTKAKDIKVLICNIY